MARIDILEGGEVNLSGNEFMRLEVMNEDGETTYVRMRHIEVARVVADMADWLAIEASKAYRKLPGEH